MARTPARWPKLAGCPRRRAQRPLPSMMIPMCLGTEFAKASTEYPRVADRHACLLRLLAHEADVLLASLLGERRDRDPDHLSVVGRVEAHVSRAQRLLDRSDLALVVDLHHKQPRLRSADLSQLVEWSGRAVIGHDDAVDQRGVGAAGADRRELAREVIHGLRHLLIGVTDDGIEHVAAPTSGPISSAGTT